MSERPDLVYLVGLTAAQIDGLLDSAVSRPRAEAREILRRKRAAIRGGYSYPVKQPRKRPGSP